MTARTKSCLILAIVFVVGVIAGALIGIHRPNDITFVIRANGEVNLRPYPRDVIHWVNEDPKMSAKDPKSPDSDKLPSAKVNFYAISPKGIPCKETPAPSDPSSPPVSYAIDQCTVTTMSLAYYYDCVNPANGHPCQDPGVGPGSSSGPHTTLEYTEKDVFHMTEPGKPNPTRPNQPGAQPYPDGNIQCSTDTPPKPYVTPIEYTAGSAIAIEWSSTVQGYSFDLSQAQPTALTCSGSGESTRFSSSNPYATCTLPSGTTPNTYSYNVTVTDSTCGEQAIGKIVVSSKQ